MAGTLLKDLELVEVEYEQDGKKAVLIFLDSERGEIRTVNFNRQTYKDGKFVKDEEKEKKVDQWCDEYFGTTFDRLTDCIGVHKDVWAYEKFNSLFETAQESKFTKDMVDQMFYAKITEITVDDIFIKIYYVSNDDGNTYASKMTMGKYLENMNKWFPDPQKKEVEYAKFQKKFGIPVSEKDSLIGDEIIVNVKSAFGNFPYGEIKPLPKRK